MIVGYFYDLERLQSALFLGIEQQYNLWSDYAPIPMHRYSIDACYTAHMKVDDVPHMYNSIWEGTPMRDFKQFLLWEEASMYRNLQLEYEKRSKQSGSAFHSLQTKTIPM